jgi:putative restriction endonuclease
MVQIFVGITDYDWFRYLSAKPNLDEVNFWQPGGRSNFKALQPGEMFLFKLHSPRNFIVGGGIFVPPPSIIPISVAWAAFGEANGSSSIEEMRVRISRYRREPDDGRRDYEIGCRMLQQPFFFAEEDWIPIPASWAPNIVVGRGYDTRTEDGRYLWREVHHRLGRQSQYGLQDEAARYGEPMLIQPRIGQGTFRIAVTDVYGRRCAVTGERTLPLLDAAHIRSYADGGEHRIDNGVLLRTDIHRLFDIGYVTITTDGRFEVSKKLREDFQNGRYYHELHGQAVAPPNHDRFRPAPEALEWHHNHRFRG